MFTLKRFGALAALLGLVAVGITAAPHKAEAWWRGGGWCCGVHVGIWAPPIVVAPAPVYVPPPAYYGPPPAAYYAPQPQGQWIPGHYEGAYWVPGHWA